MLGNHGDKTEETMVEHNSPLEDEQNNKETAPSFGTEKNRRRSVKLIEPDEIKDKKDLISQALQENVKKAQELKTLVRPSFRPLLVIKDEIITSFVDGAILKDVAESLSNIIDARISTALLQDFILEYATPEQIKPRAKELESAKKRRKNSKKK